MARGRSLQSKTIQGLFNGVSQQAPASRLEDQHTAQTNCRSSIVRGLEKRPGTEFIAKLEDDDIGFGNGYDSLVHKINRDGDEKFLVHFTKSASEPIRIYGIDGVKQTVTYDTPGDKTYCIHNPTTTTSHVKAVTVADTTIIANRGTTCAMDGTTTPVGYDFAYLWVKFSKTNTGDTALHWEIDVDATTTIGSSANASTHILTGDLKTSLDGVIGPTGTNTFNVDKVGTSTQSNVLRISKIDNGDFDLILSDSQGNSAIKVIKGKVNNMSELPPLGVDGDVVEIIGDDGTGEGSFYVKFNEATQKWIESAAPGVEDVIDNTTMPRQMLFDGVDTFDVSKITWQDRTVGDNDSVPLPSFIGQEINDIFFYKQRFGMLAHESIILSRSGDAFNFFPTTATEVLDDDPIDLDQPSNAVAVLRDALPFLDTLLLFSDERQFEFGSGKEILKPSNAAIQESTAFQSSDQVKALRSGANAYFVVEKGDFSSVREYFVETDTLVNDAADITGHVPRYLPSNINHMAANANQQIIALSSYNEVDDGKLWVYQYFWDGENKVQSAWNVWDFGGFREILGFEFFNDDLYILFSDENDDDEFDIVLEKITMEEDTTESLNFRVHGDRLILGADVTSAVLEGTPPTEVTVVTMPFDDNYSLDFDDTRWVAVHKTTGNVITSNRDRGTEPDHEIRFNADIASTVTDYIFVRTFIMTNQFSPVYVRDRNGLGITAGKLQLRTMEVAFLDSGSFCVEVTPLDRDTMTQKWTGATIGMAALADPQSVVDDGVFRFAVMADSKKTTLVMKSTSPHPLQVQAITYESTYYNRARIL